MNKTFLMAVVTQLNRVLRPFGAEASYFGEESYGPVFDLRLVREGMTFRYDFMVDWRLLKYGSKTGSCKEESVVAVNVAVELAGLFAERIIVAASRRQQHDFGAFRVRKFLREGGGL